MSYLDSYEKLFIEPVLKVRENKGSETGVGSNIFIACQLIFSGIDHLTHFYSFHEISANYEERKKIFYELKALSEYEDLKNKANSLGEESLKLFNKMKPNIHESATKYYINFLVKEYELTKKDANLFYNTFRSKLVHQFFTKGLLKINPAGKDLRIIYKDNEKVIINFQVLSNKFFESFEKFKINYKSQTHLSKNIEELLR